MSLLSSLRSSARTVVGGSLFALLSSVAPLPAVAQDSRVSLSSVAAATPAPAVVSSVPEMHGVVAAAHASGAYGSEWRTDLWVHNADTAPATVELYFAPSGSSLSADMKVSRVVPAGHTLALRDAVAAFNVSAGGVLAYTVSGASLDRVLVESNTHNFVNATTSYGSQMTPSRWDKVPSARLALEGDMQLVLPVVLDGSQYRNNLILLSDAAATLARVDIVNRFGPVVASEMVEFSPHSHTQLNDIVSRYALSAQMPGLWARITPQNGKLVAAMSVIDNVSNDSTIFLAQHVNNSPVVDNTPFGANEHNMWLPGVAYADGAQGSKWRTDLQMINAFAVPNSTTLFFYPMGTDNSVQPMFRSVYTMGFASQFLRNVLGADPFFFPMGVAGALRAETIPEYPPVPFVRTYNDTANSDGTRMTYGQGIPPRNDRDMITDVVEGRIVGIDVNNDYRANLHLQNTHRDTNNVTLIPTTVDVELLLADGTSTGVKTYQILPGEYHQINNFAHEFLGPNGTVNGGTLRITTRGVKTDGTLGSEYGGLDARVSVINNATNDGRLITATLIPPRPIDRTAEYVDFRLPDETGRIYLSNAEIRDLINGTAKTRSYVRDLADALYDNANPPKTYPKEMLVAALKEYVDCTSTAQNTEMYYAYDPIQLSPEASGMRIYFEPDGRVNDFKVFSAGVNAIRNVFRNALIDRVRAFPDSYARQPTDDKYLGVDPTWRTLDPNTKPCP